MRIFPSIVFLALAFSLTILSCAHEPEDEPTIEIKPREEAEAEKMPAPKPPLPMAPPLPSAKPALPAERPGEALNVARELPKPVVIMLKSAEAQLKKKQFNLARAQAERAYRMESRDPRTSFLLARIAAEEGDYQDAEQWAHRALENAESEANESFLWRFIARCRQKQGDSKGADSALRRKQ